MVNHQTAGHVDPFCISILWIFPRLHGFRPSNYTVYGCIWYNLKKLPMAFNGCLCGNDAPGFIELRFSGWILKVCSHCGTSKADYPHHSPLIFILFSNDGKHVKTKQ